LYRLLFNIFFKPLDAETSHKIVDTGLRLASKAGLLRAGKRSKHVEVMGLKFENRLGLGAGFDKNAKLVRPLHALGFGHVEVGTVTFHAQPGNPKPRSFRIPEYDALINRMGFNNDGAEVISKRLAKLRNDHSNLPVIGVNIGKSRIIEAKDAAEDYRATTKLVASVADYLAVNVSSPNTPGLRDLQQVESLKPILQAVLDECQGKPVLVKVSPDLADADFLEVLKLTKELGLTGVIMTNTTTRREGVGNSPVLNEAGGLSGPVLAARSIEMLKIARRELSSEYVVISVGGVSSVVQAVERIQLGADLVQVYTGLIYQGPFWPKRLAKALAN
jgi:dihydroorotate dehydrogenase